jgi:hypothetical protein
LSPAARIQGDILVALQALLCVPVCFAVANEADSCDRHDEQTFAAGEGMLGTSVFTYSTGRRFSIKTG